MTEQGPPIARLSDVVARTRAERMAAEHYDSLLRLALRLTGADAEARDLVQDAFERSIRRASSFEEGTNERAWLHSILYNAFIDRCRQNRRKQHVSDDALVNEPSESPTEPPRWASISKEQLADAIETLSPEFRDVYKLHAVEERSYKEIAESLSIPAPTVATRLLRARLKLREKLLIVLRRQEPEA